MENIKNRFQGSCIKNIFNALKEKQSLSTDRTSLSVRFDFPPIVSGNFVVMQPSRLNMSARASWITVNNEKFILTRHLELGEGR